MGATEDLMEAAKNGGLEQARAILDSDGGLVHARDESGATALHYAAIHGHRDMVKLLVERGADINSTDSRYGATPAGWTIEYLREMNGYLGIELSDLAFAIRRGDVHWVRRFLKRFPGLRRLQDTSGTPFVELARESGNRDILALFENE